jgi:hypothetical protein
LVANGSVDAIYHSGDISYANGYMASWDFFLDMISPMAGSALYLTTVGNHESDWPDTASLPFYHNHASGGECGVCSTKLIPMPAPATTNTPWWSYDIGLIHMVGMSTEHNYTIGSPQYLWIENDLSSVNRTKTPWIVFSGHRPMYVDSDRCCESADDDYGDDCTVCALGTDVSGMNQLQQNIEPLLHKYRVNLGFAGHFHDMQRQSAVFANEVVQRAEIIYNDEGFPVAYHNNPNATVWMVIGAAGNGPSIATTNYSWSEKYWDYTWGYALVSAVNSTYLYWQLINSANNEVVDRMAITQNSDPWVTDSTSSNSDGTAPETEVFTYVGIICGITLILTIFLKYVIVPRFGNICETPAHHHQQKQDDRRILMENSML